MTADERNRKLKYGHQVPRSWIPDFNATHQTRHAQPVDSPELLTQLDQALRLQRRAIRHGKARPVNLRQAHSGKSIRLSVLGGVMLAGAIGLILAFHANGSRVDQKGVLRESFSLLPTSALLALGGGVALIAASLASCRER